MKFSVYIGQGQTIMFSKKKNFLNFWLDKKWEWKSAVLEQIFKQIKKKEKHNKKKGGEDLFWHSSFRSYFGILAKEKKCLYFFCHFFPIL